MTQGFLLINKPSGPTSHDIVAKLRRLTGVKQIGHAGTLDPLAQGLLIMGLGPATKLLKYFIGLDKVYRVTAQLGMVSDSYDRLGKIQTLMADEHTWPSHDDITTSLNKFLGVEPQIPPMFSAKKIRGQKLYELARAGKTINRPAQTITIYSLNLTNYTYSRLTRLDERRAFDKTDRQTRKPYYPNLTLDIHCSAGTYIRSLIHDLGQALGCGALVSELIRTQIGDFSLEQAPELTADHWQKNLILSPKAQTKVMVFGTFDPLHRGHKYFFEQAKKFGAKLLVVITTDKNILKEKHRPPRFSQHQRLAAVQACPSVDQAYIGDESDYFRLIHEHQPDLICLGYDQNCDPFQLRTQLQALHLPTHVLRLDAYQPHVYKSSLLTQQLAKA